jgi:hypothetical protein
MDIDPKTGKGMEIYVELLLKIHYEILSLDYESQMDGLFHCR